MIGLAKADLFNKDFGLPLLCCIPVKSTQLHVNYLPTGKYAQVMMAGISMYHWTRILEITIFYE